MKLRFSVILSSLALIILVVVQFYNISVTFETKKEQFDTSYGAMVRQALFEYEPGKYTYRSDSVFLLFDKYAEELVYSFQNSLSGETIDIEIAGPCFVFKNPPETHEAGRLPEGIP